MASNHDKNNIPSVSGCEMHDVYGDLDELNYNITNETEVLENETKYCDIKKEYEELKQKYDDLSIKHDKLKERMSSLILTARAEIQRKNLLISSMREELHNFTFKHGRSFGRRKEQVPSKEEIVSKPLHCQKESNSLKMELKNINENPEICVDSSKNLNIKKEDDVRNRLGKRITDIDSKNDINNISNNRIKCEPINVEIKIKRKSAEVIDNGNENNHEWREVRTVEIKYQKDSDVKLQLEPKHDSFVSDTISLKNSGLPLKPREHRYEVEDTGSNNFVENRIVKEIESRLGPKSDKYIEATKNERIVTDITARDKNSNNYKGAFSNRLKVNQTRKELDNIERILEKRSLKHTKTHSLEDEKNTNAISVKLRLGKRPIDSDKNEDSTPFKDTKIEDKCGNGLENKLTKTSNTSDHKGLHRISGLSASDKTEYTSDNKVKDRLHSRDTDRTRNSSRDGNHKVHRSRERHHSKERQNNTKGRYRSKERQNSGRSSRDKQDSTKPRYRSKDRHRRNSRSSRERQNSNKGMHSNSHTSKERERNKQNSEYRDKIRNEHKSSRRSPEKYQSFNKEHCSSTNRRRKSKDKNPEDSDVDDGAIGEFYTLDEENYEIGKIRNLQERCSNIESSFVKIDVENKGKSEEHTLESQTFTADCPLIQHKDEKNDEMKAYASQIVIQTKNSNTQHEKCTAVSTENMDTSLSKKSKSGLDKSHSKSFLNELDRRSDNETQGKIIKIPESCNDNQINANKTDHSIVQLGIESRSSAEKNVLESQTSIVESSLVQHEHEKNDNTENNVSQNDNQIFINTVGYPSTHQEDSAVLTENMENKSDQKEKHSQYFTEELDCLSDDKLEGEKETTRETSSNVESTCKTKEHTLKSQSSTVERSFLQRGNENKDERSNIRLGNEDCINVMAAALSTENRDTAVSMESKSNGKESRSQSVLEELDCSSDDEQERKIGKTQKSRNKQIITNNVENSIVPLMLDNTSNAHDRVSEPQNSTVKSLLVQHESERNDNTEDRVAQIDNQVAMNRVECLSMQQHDDEKQSDVVVSADNKDSAETIESVSDQENNFAEELDCWNNVSEVTTKKPLLTLYTIRKMQEISGNKTTLNNVSNTVHSDNKAAAIVEDVLTHNTEPSENSNTSSILYNVLMNSNKNIKTYVDSNHEHEVDQKSETDKINFNVNSTYRRTSETSSSSSSSSSCSDSCSCGSDCDYESDDNIDKKTVDTNQDNTQAFNAKNKTDLKISDDHLSSDENSTGNLRKHDQPGQKSICSDKENAESETKPLKETADISGKNNAVYLFSDESPMTKNRKAEITSRFEKSEVNTGQTQRTKAEKKSVFPSKANVNISDKSKQNESLHKTVPADCRKSTESKENQNTKNTHPAKTKNTDSSENVKMVNKYNRSPDKHSATVTKVDIKNTSEMPLKLIKITFDETDKKKCDSDREKIFPRYHNTKLVTVSDGNKISEVSSRTEYELNNDLETNVTRKRKVNTEREPRTLNDDKIKKTAPTSKEKSRTKGIQNVNDNSANIISTGKVMDESFNKKKPEKQIMKSESKHTGHVVEYHKLQEKRKIVCNIENSMERTIDMLPSKSTKRILNELSEKERRRRESRYDADFERDMNNKKLVPSHNSRIVVQSRRKASYIVKTSKMEPTKSTLDSKYSRDFVEFRRSNKIDGNKVDTARNHYGKITSDTDRIRKSIIYSEGAKMYDLSNNRKDVKYGGRNFDEKKKQPCDINIDKQNLGKEPMKIRKNRLELEEGELSDSDFEDQTQITDKNENGHSCYNSTVENLEKGKEERLTDYSIKNVHVKSPTSIRSVALHGDTPLSSTRSKQENPSGQKFKRRSANSSLNETLRSVTMDDDEDSGSGASNSEIAHLMPMAAEGSDKRPNHQIVDGIHDDRNFDHIKTTIAQPIIGSELSKNNARNQSVCEKTVTKEEMKNQNVESESKPKSRYKRPADSAAGSSRKKKKTETEMNSGGNGSQSQTNKGQPEKLSPEVSIGASNTQKEEEPAVAYDADGNAATETGSPASVPSERCSKSKENEKPKIVSKLASDSHARKQPRQPKKMETSNGTPEDTNSIFDSINKVSKTDDNSTRAETPLENMESESVKELANVAATNLTDLCKTGDGRNNLADPPRTPESVNGTLPVNPSKPIFVIRRRNTIIVRK